MVALTGKANQLEEYRLRIVSLERDNAEKSRIAAQIEHVKRQSDEATKRVMTLTEENVRLKRQAQDRHESVLALEAKIGILTKESLSAGSNTNSARAELTRLQSALRAARADQKSADAAKDESVKREKEISVLRSQLLGLEEKAIQLEELRKKIIVLQKENADQTRQLNDKETGQLKTRPALIPSF